MRQRIWIVVAALVFVLSATVSAGEYYLSDDKDYWWYWDDAPKYEMLVPAKAESYAPQQVFDEKSLSITLTKNGPVMRVGSVAKVRGGYAALKQAALTRWEHVLSDVTVTTDTEITTSRGVKAKHFIAKGKTPSGAAAMIRFVAYLKGTDAVFLELLCKESEYAGAIRDQWIKAVNTFNWR